MIPKELYINFDFTFMGESDALEKFIFSYLTDKIKTISIGDRDYYINFLDEEDNELVYYTDRDKYIFYGEEQLGDEIYKRFETINKKLFNV